MMIWLLCRGDPCDHPNTAESAQLSGKHKVCPTTETTQTRYIRDNFVFRHLQRSRHFLPHASRSLPLRSIHEPYLISSTQHLVNSGISRSDPRFPYVRTFPEKRRLPRTHKKTARSDGSDTGGLVLLKGCIFSVLRVCSYFLTKISRARLESMANSEYPTRKMYDGKTCMSTMLLPGRTPMAMSLRILMSSPVAR